MDRNAVAYYYFVEISGSAHHFRLKTHFMIICIKVGEENLKLLKNDNKYMKL